jgi:hypothetical protein
MKKATMVLLVAGIMVLAGCSPAPVEDREVKEPPKEDSESVAEIVDEEIITERGIIMEMEELVASGGQAGELGLFVRRNISEASVEEAEKMIEILVIEQLGMIEKVNSVIYKPEYMDALNKDMKGVLNPELILNIEDEDVRGVFQDMADGFLDIVRYEETPVAETDWETLSELNKFFSEDFSAMVTLYDKIQNYKYNRMEPDFSTIYKDAVRTEELIFGNGESFLTWQLDKLYKRQVGRLLIGPEGSYIGAFVSKSGEPYESLIAASGEHPEAMLSGLVRRLDMAKNADFNEVVDVVNTFGAFGLKSPAKAVQGREDGGKELEGLVYFSIEGEPSIEKKINDALNDKALQLKDSLGIEDDISFRSTIMYGNGNYLSIIISASGTSETGDFEYEDRHVVIDMKTGESISITDLFGIPWEDLSVELEALTEKNIEDIPDFYLFRMGLAINIARENGEYYDYVVITFDDLIKYIPMETFYK